jgi:uncharacterized protein involved in exopolysaccharide biosynthesis
MSEQTLSRAWLSRSVSIILTFVVVVAGALAFAIS